MKKLVLALIIVLVCVPLVCAATLNENTKSSDYGTATGSKLVRGVANTAFGWTEIFFRPGKLISQGDHPVVAVLKGLGNAVARTTVGALEVATCWIPGTSSEVLAIEGNPMDVVK
ncbi:MAG: hypothetical protein Q8Q91_01405 [Candidatus Daviesbacteria bacterium]|nr:hypothetical protein [Candidatus Daviesbacteria bacterium]